MKQTYRSAHGLHGLLAGEVLREAKIDHLDAAGVIFACEHEVLGLDVAMADVLPVEVDQCREQLMHDQSCFPLAQVLALDDEVEQLSTFAVPVNIRKLMVESLFAILVSQKGFENQNRFFAENIMSALDRRRVFPACSS